MARYRKRKSSNLTGQLMDDLLEFTDFSWKFGAVVSIIFLFLSGWAYRWAYAFNHPRTDEVMVKAVTENFGWLIYIIPLMLFLIAVLFAWRAHSTFSKTNHT